MQEKKRLQTKILGVRVNFIKLEQAVRWVEGRLKYNKPGQITTPNPEQVVLAQKDDEFRQILNNSDLAICDGVGLALVSGITRLSGTDLMLALCQKAKQKKWRVFLLGGKPGVAKLVASSLNASYDSGAIDISRETGEERKRIIKKINACKPHLLFVAYGAPYQEKWIARNLSQLKVGMAMGVGGSFDYLAGKVWRAPEIIRSIGLEWLWRLTHQPWRLKRQLSLAKFVRLIILNKIKRLKD